MVTLAELSMAKATENCESSFARVPHSCGRTFVAWSVPECEVLIVGLLPHTPRSAITPHFVLRFVTDQTNVSPDCSSLYDEQDGPLSGSSTHLVIPRCSIREAWWWS